MVMNLELLIEDLPPMPRNRSHMLIAKGKRPMNIKTPLCREYEKDLETRLLQFSKEMEAFKTIFIPDEHYIVATYLIFTPEDLLFTQKGTISSRTLDVDAHKVMTDTIFRSIGLDDKLMRDCHIVTPVSHDGKYNYKITLKLENKCTLKNMYSWTQNTTTQEKLDLMSYALL
jgi:hypothetical protein